MNQRDILRRGEYQRNTEPDPRPVEVICAKATGCEYAQEDSCPADTFRRQREGLDKWRCTASGEVIKWREE
jgi:hypothetical protein